MRRAGVCDSLLGNEMLTSLNGPPNGAEQMIPKLPPEVLGFLGVPANWSLNLAGVRSSIMEAVSMLDSKFGVDAFDEGIHCMNMFYGCARKGPMSHYVTNFENLYEEATIDADMILSSSAKSWHFGT